MPISVATFQSGIYRSGDFSGSAPNAPGLRLSGGAVLNPDHYDQHGMVPVGRQQSDQFAAHRDGTGQLVSFKDPGPAAANTNVVYLPFKADNITSVVVPHAIASGIVNFYTENLSGCSVFIDRVTASTAANVAVNDLVVYHANAMRHCATKAQILANPALAANLPAQNAMRTLHTNAMADYATAGITLAAVTSCEQVLYMARPNVEIARKQSMGRTNVLLSGGTSVTGFRVGGVWQFWFQTWGWVTYDRPLTDNRGPVKSFVRNIPKLVDEGRHHGPTGAAVLWQAARFF